MASIFAKLADKAFLALVLALASNIGALVNYFTTQDVSKTAQATAVVANAAAVASGSVSETGVVSGTTLVAPAK